MAQRQWDVALGAGIEGVVEGAGAAIGGNAVRITVDDAVATTKAEALRAIEAAKARIVMDTWPPA